MVLLDMEMPKGCRFCHLQDVCVPFQREVVTEVVSIDTLNERHKDCPIKAEIPNNATNGDAIKALFPNDAIHQVCKDTVNFSFIQAESSISVYKSWWNAPYKPESEE